MIDYLNTFLISILTILPIIKEQLPSKQPYQKFLNTNFITIILIIGILSFGSTIFKSCDDNNQKKVSENKIDSLNSSLINIKNTLKNEQNNKKIFEERLFNEFKIIKDSATNSPRQVNNIYNTHILKANNVNIGKK